MNPTDIQSLLQSITNLKQHFERKAYRLSELDKNSLRTIIEQLYVQILPSGTSEQQTSSAPKSPETSTKPVAPSSAKDEINAELDELFVESNPVHHEEIKSTQPAPQTSSPIKQVITSNSLNPNFQLGINERLMFSKELFNDDHKAMEESIRQLKSFETIDAAFDFFDNKLSPFLVYEGKDEEIIGEYRLIIDRIYQ